MSLARLIAWQGAIAAALALGTLLTGWGSPVGIFLGAGVLGGSFLLQAWATAAAFGKTGRSLAVIVATLKLGLLIGVSALVLASTRVSPMSFAAGATTLLLAIVVETCYADRSARSSRRPTAERENH